MKLKIIFICLLMGAVFSCKNVQAAELPSNSLTNTTEKKQIKISFDTGFTDYVIEDKSFCLNQYNIILPVPSYDGYLFEGWYKEDGTKFIRENIIPNSQYDVSALEINLKAKWIKWDTENTKSLMPDIIVNFDTGTSKIYNSIGIMKNNERDTIKDAYEFPEPELPGFIFNGWYTDNNEICTENNILDIASLEDMGELNLTAHWTEDTPINSFSETSAEQDNNTKEKTVTTVTTDVYDNGCKIIKTIKDTVLKNYVISSNIEKQLFYTDGTSEIETNYIYYGYHELLNNTAMDELMIQVYDTSENPIKGICIEFKIDGKTMAVYTDAEGKASINIKKGSEFTTNIRNLPANYNIIEEPQIMGYGCMYSVLYKGKYILSNSSITKAEMSPNESNQLFFSTKTLN